MFGSFLSHLAFFSFIGSIIIMPKRCVLGRCSNDSHSGVPLYGFPSNMTLSRKWDCFVMKTRNDWWIGKSTNTMHICALHFHQNCFQNHEQWRQGFLRSLRLVTGAFPSILPGQVTDEMRAWFRQSAVVSASEPLLVTSSPRPSVMLPTLTNTPDPSAVIIGPDYPEIGLASDPSAVIPTTNPSTFIPATYLSVDRPVPELAPARKKRRVIRKLEASRVCLFHLLHDFMHRLAYRTMLMYNMIELYKTLQNFPCFH